jgi:hypothetical protein
MSINKHMTDEELLERAELSIEVAVDRDEAGIAQAVLLESIASSLLVIARHSGQTIKTRTVDYPEIDPDFRLPK